MFRKSLIVASLALLAVGAGSPASADPKFLESYDQIYGGRTFLPSEGDPRPMTALQASPSDVENPTSRILAAPFIRSSDLPGGLGDLLTYGVSLGYANSGSGLPWQIGVSLFNTHVDVERFGFEDDFFGFAVGGKVVIWEPQNANLPAVSLNVGYQDQDDVAQRWDVALAADQRLTDTLFATVNLGWSHIDPDFFRDDSDFIAAIGATWNPFDRLSFSASYTFDNDVDLEDFWAITATYAANENLILQLGGGKHSTIFGSFIWKWDR
ncbi:MAG: hypothetical protein ACK47B_21420 [Armatimonadota bacterium]